MTQEDYHWEIYHDRPEYFSVGLHGLTGSAKAKGPDYMGGAIVEFDGPQLTVNLYDFSYDANTEVVELSFDDAKEYAKKKVIDMFRERNLQFFLWYQNEFCNNE